MGYEHNDIVIMGALQSALNSEDNGMFERNDIVTTYKMNEAIAEGGGGGGSSDFSIAEVTFINSAEGGYYDVLLPYVTEGRIEYGTGGATVSDEPVTVLVPLYQGVAGIGLDMFENIDDQVTPVVTGDITFDPETFYYVVMGDGTITLAGVLDNPST